MLQQTTVPAVIPYYERWLAAFPDVASLARASERRVLRLWQGLGYYGRARHMRQAAKTMVREHGGRLPNDPEALHRLPGFGPYVTAAVLSFAFGRPFAAMDANIRRVAMRLFARPGAADPGRDRERLAEMRPLFSRRAPGLFNQAVMELGALVCRPRDPRCPACPVREFCEAFKAGVQAAIPAPRKRAYHRYEAAVAVVRDERGRYLLQKRPPGGLLAGLWEFPGGKREPGERPEDTVRREVREETGLELDGLEYMTTIDHAYTRFQVKLHVFRGRPAGPPPESTSTRRWLGLHELARYPLPAPSVRIVTALRDGPAGKRSGRR